MARSRGRPLLRRRRRGLRPQRPRGGAHPRARAGKSVLVLEAATTIGGGTRTAELTLPGFRPRRVLRHPSPGRGIAVLPDLPLTEHGVEWIDPPLAVAHPLDDGTARRSRPLDRRDGARAGAGRRGLAPAVRAAGGAGGTSSRPRCSGPSCACRATRSEWPASGCARSGPRPRWPDRLFRTERARALFAGLAAHAILPLEDPLTAAFGLVLGMTGHAVGWPLPRGGSQADRRRAGRSRARARRRDRHGRAGGDDGRPAARPVSRSSTSRRGTSSPSRAIVCPRAIVAGSSATATGPECSRSTPLSTDRSRGRRPSAGARGRCTSAARWARSRPRRPRCGAANIRSGRSCSSRSRASSIRRARRPGNTRSGPTATCRTDRRWT